MVASGEQDTGSKVKERYSKSTCTVCKVCPPGHIPCSVFYEFVTFLMFLLMVSLSCCLRTATKVSEMLGNVNTSSSLSAFEKMEEKGKNVVQLVYDLSHSYSNVHVGFTICNLLNVFLLSFLDYDFVYTMFKIRFIWSYCESVIRITFINQKFSFFLYRRKKIIRGYASLI